MLRQTNDYKPNISGKRMKTPHPACPVCSEAIVLEDPHLEYLDCPHCHLRIAGFELFDSPSGSKSSGPARILPFGVMIAETLNLDVLRRVLHNMERVFELVAADNEPGTLYSEHDFTAYLVSLVEGQQDDREPFMPGSWTLERHGRIPNELLEELVHLPTYLAVGTLSHTLRERPSLTKGIAALEGALQRGLDFVARQGLAGRGHQWLEWRRRFLTIFSKGKVLELLRDRPETSVLLCYVLGYIHQRTTEILASTAGPIQYQTREPISRDVYEEIVELTAPFKHYCHEEPTVSLPSGL